MELKDITITLSVREQDHVLASLRSRILEANQMIDLCESVEDAAGRFYWVEQRTHAQNLTNRFYCERRASGNRATV